VRFELTKQTRQAVDDYLAQGSKRPGRSNQRSLCTRQYAWLFDRAYVCFGSKAEVPSTAHHAPR
jgi:hypothetical protein